MPDHVLTAVYSAHHPLLGSTTVQFKLGEMESRHDDLHQGLTVYIPPFAKLAQGGPTGGTLIPGAGAGLIDTDPDNVRLASEAGLAVTSAETLSWRWRVALAQAGDAPRRSALCSRRARG